MWRALHSNRSTTRNWSTEHSFIGVQIHFNSRNSPAIKNLPRLHLRDHGWNRFLHMIRLNPKQKKSEHQNIRTQIQTQESNNPKSENLRLVPETTSHNTPDSKFSRLFPNFFGNQTEGYEEKRSAYDEENGIGSLGPNSSIDGVFDFARKHVLVEIILHWHFLLITVFATSFLSLRKMKIFRRGFWIQNQIFVLVRAQ